MKATGKAFMGLIFILYPSHKPQKWSFCHIFADYTLLNRLREAPPKKKTVYIWALPKLQFDPPIAQIRALCGTTILPKMRKFFKQQFWLWEWIFWQWLMSKMILRWYSDGNQGKYWWNWWKLSGSVMVYIHWRTATNNLGKHFNPPPHPPPPLGNAQIYTFFLG